MIKSVAMEDKREVILADTAGFCFGVKRAVDTVYAQLETAKESKKAIYSLGPIIHNEDVVAKLEAQGVVTVHSLDELKDKEAGYVVIRSHGVDRKTYEEIEKLGHHVIDATCPFVKKIHNIVAKAYEEGCKVIIVGDDKHPEVKGIKGWCKTPPYVVKTVEELKKVVENSKENYVLVQQTTFNGIIFKEFVEFLDKNDYNNVRVYKTICNATDERQLEAARIANEVDAMIVIGGINSSNTQKLYEICKMKCRNTYYIQTLVDLDLAAIESAKRVGITAGASTPNYIIKEVHDACQN